jgi:hypothetical protein
MTSELHQFRDAARALMRAAAKHLRAEHGEHDPIPELSEDERNVLAGTVPGETTTAWELAAVFDGIAEQDVIGAAVLNLAASLLPDAPERATRTARTWNGCGPFRSVWTGRYRVVSATTRG